MIGHPELAELAIDHIDCDAFYAAIEKRDDPTLKDKPVIVGRPGGRGIVTTACYVARRIEQPSFGRVMFFRAKFQR
jgi:DNA polymerase IV